MGYQLFLTILVIAGFSKDTETAEWRPLAPAAITRLFNFNALVSARNPLAFVKLWKKNQMAGFSDSTRTLADGGFDKDKLIYEHATNELGERALDDDGAMFPAWYLRRLLELEWARNEDTRLRFYAYVLVDSSADFKFVLNPVIVAAPAKVVVGCKCTLLYAWNAHVRNQPRADAQFPARANETTFRDARRTQYPIIIIMFDVSINIHSGISSQY